MEWSDAEQGSFLRWEKKPLDCRSSTCRSKTSVLVGVVSRVLGSGFRGLVLSRILKLHLRYDAIFTDDLDLRRYPIDRQLCRPGYYPQTAKHHINFIVTL